MANFNNINVSIWGVKEGFNPNIFSSNSIPEVSATFTDTTRLLMESNTSIFYCIEHTTRFSIVTLIDPNCTDFKGRTAFLAFSLVVKKGIVFNSSPLKCLESIRDFYLSVQSPTEKLNRFTPSQIETQLNDVSIAQANSNSYNSLGYCFSANSSEIDDYLKLSKNYFKYKKSYFFNPSSKLMDGTSSALDGFRRFEIKEIEQKETDRIQSGENLIQQRKTECKNVENLILSNEYEKAAVEYKKLKDNKYVDASLLAKLNQELVKIQNKNKEKQLALEKEQDKKNIEKIATLYSKNNPKGALHHYNNLKDKTLFTNKDLLEDIKRKVEQIRSAEEKERIANENAEKARQKRKKRKSILIVTLLVLIIGSGASYVLFNGNNENEVVEIIVADPDIKTTISIDSSNIDNDRFIAYLDSCPELYGSSPIGCPNCELDTLINKVEIDFVLLDSLNKKDSLFKWKEGDILFKHYVRINEHKWEWKDSEEIKLVGLKSDDDIDKLNRYFHKKILSPNEIKYKELIKKADSAFKLSKWEKSKKFYEEVLNLYPKDEHADDRIKEIEGKLKDIKVAEEKAPKTEENPEAEGVTEEAKKEAAPKKEAKKEAGGAIDADTNAKDDLNKKCKDEYNSLKKLHEESMKSQTIKEDDLKQFEDFTKGDCIDCEKSNHYMKKIESLIKELKPFKK